MRIVGHERARGLLRNALLKERLPHALLFAGPEAVGKRLVALELAKDLLCVDSEQHSKQALCALFERGEHPDLHFLSLEEEKREISIEQVRSLIDVLRLNSYFGGRRVAIIDDAHLLSIPAQNALLLTLEEPPRECTLILISHLPHRFLPTILSRTQEISFGPLSEREIEHVLELLSIERKLAPVLDGSLSGLRLDELRPSPSAVCSPGEAIRERAESYERSIAELSLLVREALWSDVLGIRLSRAVELADKSVPLETVFRLISLALRERILAHPDPSLADTWLRSLEIERLIAQRNLNPVLQLSALVSTAPTPPLR